MTSAPDFDRPGTTNGPTEAIRGRFEHLGGSALAVRKIAVKDGSALQTVCREKYADFALVPLPSFEHVFDSVQDGAADLAMIPLDTSAAGRIAEIHHLLPDSTLHIVAEHFLYTPANLDPAEEATDQVDEEITRVVVLAREPLQAMPRDEAVVTSLVFDLRNIPGALYKALGGLASNRVNMTKLESYMVGGQFAATRFFAEVDGHPDDPALKLALEELEFFTTALKLVGVFPADPFRSCRP